MTHDTHDPLPKKACVWMEAGVINYWLCDRGFDCEHCPLDQALRGGFHGQPPVGIHHLPNGGRPFAEQWPEGIRFHASHLWLSPVEGDKWALGLDHLALAAFSDPPLLSLPRAGRRIRREEELLALLVGADALRWPAPMDATVLECNTQWASDTSKMRNAPYPDSWALLIKLNEAPGQEWLAPAVMEERNREERTALRDFVSSRQGHSVASCQTSADGGTLIAAPDRLLPMTDYLTFLRDRWRLIDSPA